MEQLGSHWTDFYKIWIFIENLSRKCKVYYNLTRITCTLHEDQYKSLITSRPFLFRMRNVADKSCRRNQSTHFMFKNPFLRKSCHVWDNVKKYLRDSRATNGYRARTLCMLDIQSYKHALRICNTNCFHCNNGCTNALQCYFIGTPLFTFSLTLRLLMSYIYIYIYIYMEHPFLMFLDHTQRRTSVGRTPLDEW